MAEDEVRVYGYRWVALAVFMLTNLTSRVLLISYGVGGLATAYGLKNEIPLTSLSQ